MEKPTVLDLVDLLTMSLDEISGVADILAEVLAANRNVDVNLYKSAYAKIGVSYKLTVRPIRNVPSPADMMLAFNHSAVFVR